MKNFQTLILCFFALPVMGQVPYNTTPDWESDGRNMYSTGLALADMNNDGYKDLVFSNGNDMGQRKVEIYFNRGDGTFPVNPDWESSDVDYHGHLTVGDLNYDGWNDIVVSVFIGAAGFDSPGKIKIYYNYQGEVEPIPSFQSEPFYNFSNTLGDADGDGDLDIAAACSEMYSGLKDYGRIFYNNNGVFDSIALWKTTQKMGGMDVEFADFDNNGYSDVFFGCEGTPSYIHFADSTGNISKTSGWHSSDIFNTNSIDVGLIGNDVYPDVVLTNNNQLGGDGKLRMFRFNGSLPDSSQSEIISAQYSDLSGILLYDVTQDGITDLIFGGWWKFIRVLKGESEGFNSTPVFNTVQTSVVEAIHVSDLGREAIDTLRDTIPVTDHPVSMIFLQKQVVENIISIKINNLLLNSGQYGFVPGKNRIWLASPANPGDIVYMEYEYSANSDMVISNWDKDQGNFIYYNQTGVNVRDISNVISAINLYPNPVNDYFMFQLSGHTSSVNFDIFNLSSQKVMRGLAQTNEKVDISHLQAGIYMVRIQLPGKSVCLKLVKN